jgi:hypothetical protein
VSEQTEHRMFNDTQKDMRKMFFLSSMMCAINFNQMEMSQSKSESALLILNA